MNRRIGWIVLGVAAGALLILGSRQEPTAGSSEDRLFAIARQMKCLQCVGENVANSQAAIAVEMRDEIRRQTQAGATDDEIFSSFADSYGESVLLNPSSSGFAALVWVIPVVVVAIGLFGVVLVFTRARRDPTGVEVDDADRDLVERARQERRGVMTAPRLDPDTLAGLEDERDHLLRSLDDLDAELDAGDLTEDEHRSLHDEYTARAAEVIHAIDEHRVAMTSAPRQRSTSPHRDLGRGGRGGRVGRGLAVGPIVGCSGDRHRADRVGRVEPRASGRVPTPRSASPTRRCPATTTSWPTSPTSSRP